MGLFKSLFGSGGSETTTQLQKASKYPQAQQDMLAQLVKQATGGISSAAPTYQGAMSVPTTGMEQGYLDWVKSLSTNKAMNQLVSGEPAYDVGPEWAQKLYQDVWLPKRTEEQNALVNSLKDTYSGPGGYYGSTRMNKEVDLAKKFAEEKAATLTSYEYEEEKARRAAIDAALGRAETTIPTYTGIQKEAGAYQRGIEQEKIMGELQRYLMGEEVGGVSNPMYNPAVNVAMSLLGFSPFIYSNVTTTETDNPGIFPSIMAGASQGLGQAGGNWMFGGGGSAAGAGAAGAAGAGGAAAAGGGYAAAAYGTEMLPMLLAL